MLASLAQRRLTPELMDDPGVEPEMIRRSLRFIRRVNTLLGYTRATLSHLDRFSRSWKPGERITVLDVATGSADIPRAIARWGRQRGFDLRIVGLDLHALTAGIAKRETANESGIRIVRGDAARIPFADGSFDYVITNMFLHHLHEDAVVAVLREMDRVASRGIIAADLLRHRRAYLWISFFTMLSNPMLKHDARVSVVQAFTQPEVLALRDRAGIGYTQYHRHFGHRFVLSGERPEDAHRCPQPAAG